MTAKKIIVATALVLGATLGTSLVTSLGLSSAALAQSAYTTGTIASSDRAGYPAASGYGAGLYAYAPGYVDSHAARSLQTHERRGRVDVAR
jgi:hypothetical protein